jgi:uncharacterized membrane protein YidH (DUF202 family)
MMAMWGGHGRGWSEPLAIGRWARFKQKMREPITTTDVWVGLGVFPVLAVVIVLLLVL